MNKKIKFFLYIVAGIFIVLFICSTALTYYFMMEVAGVIQRNSKSQDEIINNTENSVADQKTLIHLSTNAVGVVLLNNAGDKSLSSEQVKNLKFMDDMDQIYEIYKKMNLPSMCESICAESVFKLPENKSDRKMKLVQFFQEEQNRAFDDIEFRLILENTHSITMAFPQPLRDIMRKMDGYERKSQFELFSLSLELQSTLLQYVYYIKNHERAKIEKNIGKIIKLRKKCKTENDRNPK